MSCYSRDEVAHHEMTVAKYILEGRPVRFEVSPGQESALGVRGHDGQDDLYVRRLDHVLIEGFQ